MEFFVNLIKNAVKRINKISNKFSNADNNTKGEYASKICGLTRVLKNATGEFSKKEIHVGFNSGILIRLPTFPTCCTSTAKSCCLKHKICRKSY